MTNDTRRALEIIKPIADELCISVKADDRFLYVDNVGIGISGNSTWATLWEFIGYLTIKYDNKFRQIKLTDKQLAAIKRYWADKEYWTEV